MKYSVIPSARNLVYCFKSRGIKDIVISPGSRNAPLILSFSADPFFNCFSIVDERCAAFFALGMAQNRKRPVAVVCTSGSALLNYYPAVSEAFYSNIPLVVVSADRPSYKIDVGDGQTIRQDHVFERHIGCSANLRLDVAHAPDTIRKFAPKLLEESQETIEKHNDETVFKALDIAFEQKQPVHINIPFEEPLYQLDEFESKVLDISHGEEKIEGIQDIEQFVDIWNSCTKKMVLVGVNHPDEIDGDLLEKLAKDPSVLVFTETTSNLHHPRFFPSIDSIILPLEKSRERETKFKALQPDVLLTFGGLIVSKKIKAFLRDHKPKHHWHVHGTKAYDTYFSLSQHFKTTPQNFLNVLLDGANSPNSPYAKMWDLVKEDYIPKRETYLKKVPYSDFKAFGNILPAIPHGYQLHLSNSSTVRYAQLFDIHPSIKVFCNRGTSGIDGSTSTAIGASYHNASPTLLITGDLSFFYDSNAFWNAYLRHDFRIIVINNSGGGIFRIISGKEDSREFETFFETKHNLTAKHICAQFNMEYQRCTNVEELDHCLHNFFEKSLNPRLLEVFTPRTKNDKILLDYFDFIS